MGMPVVVVPESAAEDSAFVAQLTRLVNDSYATSERGIWHDGLVRTTPPDTCAAIRAGQVAVARDADALVGTVRIRLLDDETGWFGALAVSTAHGGNGIGTDLVEFAERQAEGAGARHMQLELVLPTQGHSHTDRLAAWYRRRGYTEVERRPLVDVDPDAVPYLAVPCEVSIMRKPLNRGVFSSAG